MFIRSRHREWRCAAVKFMPPTAASIATVSKSGPITFPRTSIENGASAGARRAIIFLIVPYCSDRHGSVLIFRTLGNARRRKKKNQPRRQSRILRELHPRPDNRRRQRMPLHQKLRLAPHHQPPQTRRRNRQLRRRLRNRRRQRMPVRKNLRLAVRQRQLSHRLHHRRSRIRRPRQMRRRNPPPRKRKLLPQIRPLLLQPRQIQMEFRRFIRPPGTIGTCMRREA